MTETAREIVVIDLWTDTNRGDNALQLALVDMLRRHHPGARITGVFRFGTNELDRARPEIASTAAALDEVLGGVRRTYYSEPFRARLYGRAHGFRSFLSFIEALACIGAFLLLRRASRSLIGRARYRSLAAVRDADQVIWKGKNFRDYRGLMAVTRTMTLCSAGYFASLLRPTIDCVNASFWPIRPAVQRRLYRRAFGRCRSITVRDTSSVPAVSGLLGPEVRVTYCPDLSFGLLADPDAVKGVVRSESRPSTVAVTITAWGGASAKRAYLDALVHACARLVDLGADRFVVVPQVTRASEDNTRLAAEFARRVSEPGRVEVDVLGGQPAIGELLSSYSGCRMLIGARMHSCVFARAMGVPFVALSYDTGPKWDVLTVFWDPSLVLPYGTDTAAVSAACERVWRIGAELVEESQAAWDDCVRDADLNVTWLHA